MVIVPSIIQKIYAKRLWSFPETENKVYLTFDDGPIPEVTPWVLSHLKRYKAKATFFCIGENIKKYPEIYSQILKEGHAVGNHTYNHLNGWKTSTQVYIENIEKCNAVFSPNSHQDENLKEQSTISNQQSKINNIFRPPYGKMTSKQARIVLEKGYKIVMWSILSKDYKTTISKEKCLLNVLNNLKPGSIVVFHDSLKAAENLKFVLPKILEYIKMNNWQCVSIPTGMNEHLIS
ncbi:MAG: peptidoglycan/xylan/chitin deacetylase (PgdA/CDA1 family) [Patiriisocius sp.]